MRFQTQPGKRLIAAIAILVSLSLFALGQSRAVRRSIDRRPVSAPAGSPAPATETAVRNPHAATGQSLPLRRVILYSNGVAYFERRGMVTGRAEINLSFKQSQVDDVLKSLVVLDLGRGRVGAPERNSVLDRIRARR